MIRALRGKYTNVNIIIPFWAKSAATLLSLGATRIVMHEYGELGPLDMQIRKDDDVNPTGTSSSALNVQSSLQKIEQRSQERVLEMLIKYRLGNGEMMKIGRSKLAEMLLDHSAKFYAPLLEKLDTMEIGIMERYLNIGRMYAMRILRLYTDTTPDNIIRILNYLVYECPDHGHVVDDTLLKAYLPNVIRADEDPFSIQYYNQLEKLSILLMEDPDWDDIVGPLDSLLPHAEPAKLRANAKKSKKQHAKRSNK
jgi:hypothetical protein